LGWGNYNRSSQIQSGFSDTVRLRLLEGTPRATGRIPLDLRRPDPAAAPGRCELLWPSEHGAFYRVDWSADLTDWHALASFLPAADSTASFTIDLGTRLGFVPPAAFFRVTRQD
jgi:hypothetical protein